MDEVFHGLLQEITQKEHLVSFWLVRNALGSSFYRAKQLKMPEVIARGRSSLDDSETMACLKPAWETRSRKITTGARTN